MSDFEDNQTEGNIEEATITSKEIMQPFLNGLKGYLVANQVQLINKEKDRFLVPIAKQVPVCINRANGKTVLVDIYVNNTGDIVFEGIGSVTYDMLGDELTFTEYDPNSEQ